MTQTTDNLELLTDALGYEPQVQHPRSHDDNTFRVIAGACILAEEGTEEDALREAVATVAGWEAGEQSHG